ncbi:MAG: hypothetical protein H7A40_03085 [Chlamydiales bacterium]|nr:hypothetical protein [Chlamydiales bacterium]
MSVEVNHSSPAIHQSEISQSDSDQATIKELFEYATNLIATLRQVKKGKGDIELNFKDEQIDLHQFLSQVEEQLSNGDHSIEELQNINQLLQSAIDQVKAKPKKRLGYNMGMAMRPLVINHDKVSNTNILNLINEGNALTTIMNRSRQLAEDLRNAKTDIADGNYKHEELIIKIQSYQNFMDEQKRQHPELLKDIPNPIEDLPLDELKGNSSYFNTNYDQVIKTIDKKIDQLSEVITSAQSLVTRVTLYLHKGMKESVIISEIFHCIYKSINELIKHINGNSRGG